MSPAITDTALHRVDRAIRRAYANLLEKRDAREHSPNPATIKAEEKAQARLDTLLDFRHNATR